MKKLLTILFTVLIFATILCISSCGSDTGDDTPSLNVSNLILNLEDNSSTSSETTSSTSSQDSSTASQEETSSTTTSCSPSYTSSTASAPETYDGDWNLILVNSKNLLPSDFSIKTANIGNRAMDERIVDITKKMIDDAKADGVDLLICSSYRSVERQETLFAEQIQSFLNQGYSQDDARTEAAKWVAVPRTSEHHTGLALDIVTPTYQVLDFGFEKTEAFKWLYNHCTEYGFILRYPKDKADITGIVYEPWHYRYVGIEAAKYIHENGLCLEEYLQ